ncbi:MAG: UDP-3-O-(3-hydroxymyristoyl)glucosamine N-acyltransferase [Rickettsiales bacterium TMED174]|nr:MAG: UDP-3-O-(3-hydroxymyristoyl)glucosamine N-acyltransferase [Rickettsiales bacterium TMED174]|tara:strand:+ start:1109 stop:2029 length:921 start_codon:yes stop_codon:yes gene_type:complete
MFPKKSFDSDVFIKDVKTLDKANENDISFFENVRYKKYAQITKAGACITSEKLSHFLPKKCIKINVRNVLFDLATILKQFYPTADVDSLDETVKEAKKSKYSKVSFGNNVLLGNNVKIGKHTLIGSNNVIEQNVIIGEKVIIGSNNHFKNCIIDNNVVIQSGCNIGLKGFGFLPIKGKNLKMSHIGRVLISENVEIASGCTIDRGSVSDTIIGKNTYLDNQVHVAHNVKIGNNCMIAGQVGIAGSSTIGDNVSIGGQAGISGHLKIGNNVKIGGGSGVIKDIEDNQMVMGYPAVPLKEFLKKNIKD